MSEWKEVIASDFCTEVTDGTHDSPKPVSVGKYLLTSKHLQEYSLDFANAYMISEEDYNKAILRSKVEQYDILFSMIGTIGTTHRVKISNVDFAVKNMGIFKLGGNCLKSKWLYYWLKTRESKEYINSCLSGTTQGYMTLKALRNFPIAVPDSLTMESITSILSSLDDKIAVNKKICENLEAQAQALFKHWFVDFAPFKDGKFVESELGLIPEGWRVGTLGEYVDNLGGYSYKGSELQPSRTAMATIKNFVRGGGFKIEGYKEIIISKNIKDHQYINLFDVLVAHTDLTQNAEVVGNPAIILSTAGYEKLIMSMDLTKVVPKDKRLTAPLIHSILSTSKFKEHALGYVNGTTVLHMSKKAVPEYKLAMPNNLDVIKELSSLLDNLYSAMSETYAENIRLTSLRDTLLPKLMSGQIKL